jgi:hypothetical protein
MTPVYLLLIVISLLLILLTLAVLIICKVCRSFKQKLSKFTLSVLCPVHGRVFGYRENAEARTRCFTCVVLENMERHNETLEKVEA